MGQASCDVCGKSFSYKDKLVAEWVSVMGRMSVECCGAVYVPTFFSNLIFYVLLYASTIFAFYVEFLSYFGIVLAWCLALSFIAPLFIRFRTLRGYRVGDSFMKRVFLKTTWGALLGYIYVVLGLDITNYRKFHSIVSINSFVLVSAVGLAAVILFALVIAVIRVLAENKKALQDRS